MRRPGNPAQMRKDEVLEEESRRLSQRIHTASARGSGLVAPPLASDRGRSRPGASMAQQLHPLPRQQTIGA